MDIFQVNLGRLAALFAFLNFFPYFFHDVVRNLQTPASHCQYKKAINRVKTHDKLKLHCLPTTNRAQLVNMAPLALCSQLSPVSQQQITKKRIPKWFINVPISPQQISIQTRGLPPSQQLQYTALQVLAIMLHPQLILHW